MSDDMAEPRKDLPVHANRLLTGFDRTVEALDDLAEEGDADAAALREEFETLRSDLTELCTRADALAERGEAWP